MNKYCIYQAHTAEILYYETIYSIYSLSLFRDLEITYIIYTDNVAFFEPYLKHLKVEYRELRTEEITDWKGDYNFIHRVKIKMLQDVLKRFHGSFLYVDSDTYFTSSVADTFNQIEKGFRFMHCHEKNLDNSKIYGPLLGHKIEVEGTSVSLGKEIEIWNAGAIGFSSADNLLIDEVLKISDTLYHFYQRHVIEQFSFSLVLQRAGKLNNLEDKIFHYWTLKEFRAHLFTIFQSPESSHRENLEKIVAAINPASLIQEKINWKKRGIARLFQRLLKKQFQLSPLPPIGEIIGNQSI